VLKSDYGCEGEEVVIGADTSPADWSRTLCDALPARWIAQRRFCPRVERVGQGADLAGGAQVTANYGVYLVGGRAAGLFTRLQSGCTDRGAVCAPTLVKTAPARAFVSTPHDKGRWS
jgi:hypothetical protein